MGRPVLHGALVAVALLTFVSTGAWLPAAEAAPAPDGMPEPRAAGVGALGDPGLVDPAEVVLRYRDAAAGLSVVPPLGWIQAPASSVDQGGDDQVYEVARFQVRIRDAALYAQPLPVTSGLLADAGAVLVVGLAREGSAVAGADLAAVAPDAVQHVPGASAADGETTYDGFVTFTRLLVARGSARTAVIRAFVPTPDRDALAPTVLAAIASATVDPTGPSGPRYVAPAPPEPPAAPEPAAAAVDPSAETRADILARAALMLGTPYLWGGNAPGRVLDCSAYVSAAWGIARYTTDSLWAVAVPVAKDDLLPGDAMDLETWRDPAGFGHIRLFEAWANAAHSLVWVYEETPPRAIHRVIAYDDRYQPMRLAGLSAAGVAPLVPAPLATRRPTATPAPRPHVTPRVVPTPRPTARPTPRPTATASRALTTARRSASPTHR